MYEKFQKEFDFMKERPYCGFSLPQGWFDLVWKLCEDLREAKFDGVVAQVKEKFGGLRFYADNASEECFKLISKAESESHNICQVCGNPGKEDTSGSWMRTLCDKCKEDRK